MLSKVFHAPLRLLHWTLHAPLRLFQWVLREGGPSPKVQYAREQYPDGGRCHICGEVSEPDLKECDECKSDRQNIW